MGSTAYLLQLKTQYTETAVLQQATVLYSQNQDLLSHSCKAITHLLKQSSKTKHCFKAAC